MPLLETLAVKAAQSPQDSKLKYKEVAQRHLADRTEISPDQLSQAMKEIGHADGFITDKARRAQRRALTMQLQKIAVDYSADYAYEAFQMPWIGKETAPLREYQCLMDRAGTPKSRKRNEELNEIFLHGDPKAKGAAIREAYLPYRDMTADRLLAMTPEEMMKDYPRFTRLLQLVAESEKFVEKATKTPPEVELDIETLALLEKMNALQNIAASVKAKLDVIANPYYEFLDEEKLGDLFGLDNQLSEQGCSIGHPVMDYGQVLNNLHAFRDAAVKDQTTLLEEELKRSEIDPQQAIILDAEGNRLFRDGDLTRTGKTEQESLLKNATVTVVNKKDGSIRSIRMGKLRPMPDEKRSIRGGGYADMGDPKGKLKNLFRQLDATDSAFLFTNSGEFKRLKTALKEFRDSYEPLGAAPDDNRVREQKEKFEALKKAAEAYTAYKSKKTPDKLNRREQDRLEACRAICEMSGDYLELLEIANTENQPKQAVANTDSREVPRNTVVAKARGFYLKGDARGVDQGSGMEELRKSIADDLNKYDNLFTKAPALNDTEKEIARTLMAKMVVYDLILQERIAEGQTNTPTVKAGPIETRLNQDLLANFSAMSKNAVVTEIAASSGFRDMVGDITPDRVLDFLSRNEAREISARMAQEEQSRQQKPSETTKQPMKKEHMIKNTVKGRSTI